MSNGIIADSYEVRRAMYYLKLKNPSGLMHLTCAYKLGWLDEADYVNRKVEALKGRSR